MSHDGRVVDHEHLFCFTEQTILFFAIVKAVNVLQGCYWMWIVFHAAYSDVPISANKLKRSIKMLFRCWVIVFKNGILITEYLTYETVILLCFVSDNFMGYCFRRQADWIKLAKNNLSQPYWTQYIGQVVENLLRYFKEWSIIKAQFDAVQTKK